MLCGALCRSKWLAPFVAILATAVPGAAEVGRTMSASPEEHTLLLTDFTAETADLDWRVVNDNVMGGRSEGGFQVMDGVLMFAGRTNTRGGGFSSIRTGALSLDLASGDGIRLRVLGDGRRYTWRLTTDARYYGREVAYWADFETKAGEWQSVEIPFSTFVPRFRGSVLDGPVLNTANITGMGLMIYDKLDGAFALQLDRVESYAGGEDR